MSPTQHFKEKGYFIYPNFLTPEEHAKYLNSCHDVMNDKHNTNYAWAYNDNGTINKMHGACNSVPDFLELASHPRLIEIARQCLPFDNEIDVYISKFFPMMPSATSTLMHQDNYFFRGDPSNILSCAVYLEDTTKENGCLRIVEGSHKLGFFPHTIGAEGVAEWIDEQELNEYNIVDMQFDAPYAVFFNINIVHGCYINTSLSSRHSLAWEYINSSDNNLPNTSEKWCDRNSIT